MKYQLMEYAGVAIIAGAIAAFDVAAGVGAVGVYLLIASVLQQMGERNDD